MTKIIDMKNPTAVDPEHVPEPVKSIWCRIGLHVWSRWEFLETVNIYDVGESRPYLREAIYTKQCCECDLPKMKRVKL